MYKLPFQWGSDVWNLIELVFVLPLQVKTTYGSDDVADFAAAKLSPSIKAIVSNHPTPCALIPWSVPMIHGGRRKNYPSMN